MNTPASPRLNAFPTTLATIMAICMAGISTQAATKTWNDTGTTWATAGNWTGGAPANSLATDIALFNSTTFTNQPDYGTTSVNGIQVGDGTTLTGSLTLTGTALSLGSSGIVIAANAGTVSLGNSVKIGANQSWANNSSSLFTVGATVTNVGNSTAFTLTLNGSGSGGTNLTGIISNGGATGTTALTVNTTGSGVSTLSGNNTFTGGTTLSGGKLRATTSAAALGAGSLTLGGGGELQLANDTGLSFGRNTTVSSSATITSDRLNAGAGVTHTLGTLGIGAQTLSINAGSNVTSGTAGVSFGTTSLSIAGAVFNTGAGTNLTLGAIGGNYAFTKQGSGQLTLNTASTRNGSTGQTTLSGGTLRLGSLTALNSAGTNYLFTFTSGTLSVGVDTGGTVNGTAFTVGSNTATIELDRATAGAGVTNTFNTVSIGAGQLNVTGGSNVTSGTAGATFVGSNPTFVAATLSGNATFNVTNPVTSGTTTLLNMNGVISGGTNTLTKIGNGTLVYAGTTNANTYTGLTTVSGGELQLNKTAATVALAGNVTVGGTGSVVKLIQRDQIVDTASVAVTAGGTFNLNGLAETVAGVTLTGSVGSPATLDLAGTSGGSGGNLKLTGATPSLTFGANTQLVGAGNISPSTLANPLTFNFNGGQVSGGNIQVSNGSALTNTTFNITSGMGAGTFTVGGSGNTAGTVMAVNLNHTGSMNLGSTILAYSNLSGGTPTRLNITVANTATGMSGGIISPALLANSTSPQTTSSSDLYNGLQNTLTFTGGGSGFTLSGGVLDVRSSVGTANYGTITTNGNDLTISGGTLLGNSLPSTSGAITLSSGYFGLRNTAASTNFTINSAGGTDGRTVKMLSGDTGTFMAASGTAGQRIIINAQTDGGTWDMGTVNAGQNYTITNSGGTTPFASAFASYTIGANSGLNGVIMGANAIPTLLTLGVNGSFLAASSTAAARTYNVGVTGGGNDIVVAASGNIGFGINNTDSTKAQIINLNRDKGADTVSLISNGASTGSAVNIATNQSGAGNLYVMTKTLTLNSGVTFGGTGGIYTDRINGNSTNDFPLGNFGGNIAGASSQVTTVFNINGTLNGTNTVNLNQDNTAGGTFVVGSTATIGGTQTWVNSSIGGGYFANSNFSNQMTTGSNWTSGSVSFTARGAAGTFEASTSSVSPGTSSNYKFNSLALSPGGGSTTGGYKLLNATQNDGGSAKEALYAGTFAITGGISDSSNGHFLFSLNGQDLYVDRFNGITGLSNKGLSFQNDVLNTTSEIRALSVAGDTLVGGSFQVLNGATLQFNGGNVNNLIFGRNTGGTSGALLVADTAAAPNNGVANQGNVKTTLFHNNTAVDVGTFTSFLGSGTDTGANTGTNATNTNGTLRILGGSYSSSGYILNPVGTTGLIDTTDGVTDTTLNDVLIRGNTASDSGAAGNSTAFPALIVAGTTTIKGNLIIGNATGAANQATLRVGGDSAVGYSTSTGPSAHSGTGTLIVTGNLTTESTVNVSIQSNGIVKAAGDVSIAGAGTSVAFATNPITGKDGVGINASSHFTLNGNKGAGTPQTIAIVPNVGNFHVGDGSAGTLTGTAAQAQLTANLTSATSADINGATSVLDLNGYNFTANGSGLTIGGKAIISGLLTGNTTVNSDGILQLGNGGATGTIALASSITNNGTFSFNRNNSVVQGTDFSGAAITGTGGVTQTGTGTTTLNAANAYSGKTTVANGTLSFTNGNASATGTQALGTHASVDLGVTGISSGVLNYTGAAGTLAKNVNALGNGTDTIQNSGSGLLTLAGTLTKNGTVLTLKGGSNGIDVTGTIAGTSANSDLIVDGGTATLSTANTYNGPTFIINGATLNANAVNALPTENGRTAVALDSTGSGTSTLALGASQSIASLTGLSTSAVNLNANTLTIGTGSGSTTFAGVVSGTGGVLTKDGASTQILSSANTYTGDTTITGGTLALGVSGSINSSAVITVQSGAIFDVSAVTGGYTLGAQTLSGYGTVNGPVTIGVTGTLAPSVASTGTMTFSSDLSLAGVVTMNIGSASSFDVLAVAGTLNYGGTLTINRLSGAYLAGETYGLFTSTGHTGSYDSITVAGTSLNAANGYTTTVDGLTYSFSVTDTSGILSVIAATAIPEPATYAALLGAVGLGLAVVRRRRVKA